MQKLAIALSIWIACLVAPAVWAQGGLGALLEAGVEGPVVVVDLVKFKPGGAAKYAIYDKIAEAKVKDLGGEVIFRGVAREVAGLKSEEWDRVTFRKYPTMQAVIAMGSSKEYQGAFPNRLASVAKSFVYAFSGERPSIGGRANTTLDPMNAAPAPPSDDAVYMLNMLRFKKDGGREKYFMKYGAGTGPLMAKAAARPLYLLKGIGPVISDEEVDRLILVVYPSPQSFRDLITSQEYRDIAHLRTDAIELGLLWPFTKVDSE